MKPARGACPRAKSGRTRNPRSNPGSNPVRETAPTASALGAVDRRVAGDAAGLRQRFAVLVHPREVKLERLAHQYFALAACVCRRDDAVGVRQ